MRLLISSFLTIYGLYTSISLFGPGTCSFDGEAGGRIVFINRFYDDSGVISCNLAGLIVIVGIILYWVNIFLKFKKSENYQDYKKEPFYSPVINSEKKLEIDNLKDKLNKLNEEDELEFLREELNKKRLTKGLISLSEYEQLEIDIKNIRNVYKSYKKEYFELIESRKNAKTDKIFGTIIFGAISIYTFYLSISDEFWIGFMLGIICLVILIYNFVNKNKFLLWSDSEIERLSIEKESSLVELKKLKKIYKNQTI